MASWFRRKKEAESAKGRLIFGIFGICVIFSSGEERERERRGPNYNYEAAAVELSLNSGRKALARKGTYQNEEKRVENM